MRADDRALVDLAASVADGQPVDWQHVEAKSGAAQRRIVRHLRLVEDIASLYRSIEDEEPVLSSPATIIPPVAEPTGPRWGRLVILDPIGRGTSSEVFEAWDTELHRTVALKLLHDTGEVPADEQRERHARVLQEARRLARVRHANVVHVYGAEEHDGRVGLWMELVRGESLEQIVATRGTLSASEASSIGQDLCAALAAVHGSGVLHRDVKAQNVLRESGGRTVLMDFGTGEELQENSGSARMAGTPLYVAPEVFGGQAATIQSDLYSLGVLLFYLVSGQYPITAASIEQLARAHAHGHRKRLRDVRPDLPAPFVQAIERALDADPAQRYRTAGEMEVALREGATRFQPAPVTNVAWWRAFVRTPELASLYVVGLALVVALGAIVWSRIGSTSTPPSPAAIRSIAVLPLADLSTAATPPYLTEGLTDQLITTLGQVEAFRVTPRVSMMRFKDRGLPPVRIAQELKVDHLLECTVTIGRTIATGPELVRINARLIEAGAGTIVWSDTFERALGDTFALQSDIARSIVGALRAVVTPEESTRLMRVQRTTPAAERAYYEGRYYLGTADRAQLAFDAFRRTLELDPNHAAAHAGLAASYLALGSAAGKISQPEARAQALAAATRAAQLDPDSSEAHTVLADLKFAYDWDWQAADDQYQRALDLNASSTYARTQYARYLAAARRLDEALGQANRAAESDPLSIDATQVRGLILYFKGDYQAALEALEHALSLDAGRPGTHMLLARVHAANGALTAAISENERALELATQPVPGWNAHLLMLYALHGRREEARVGLQRLEAQTAESSSRLGQAHHAYIYVALGDRGRGLDLLERAVAMRDPDVVFLAVDPRVSSLNDDPRFAQLVKKLGIP